MSCLLTLSLVKEAKFVLVVGFVLIVSGRASSSFSLGLLSLELSLLKCETSCLQLSLPHVLDNLIQQILYMYNISRYISDIGVFVLSIVGINIGPKNPVSVRPYFQGNPPFQYVDMLINYAVSAGLYMNTAAIT